MYSGVTSLSVFVNFLAVYSVGKIRGVFDDNFEINSNISPRTKLKFPHSLIYMFYEGKLCMFSHSGAGCSKLTTLLVNVR